METRNGLEILALPRIEGGEELPVGVARTQGARLFRVIMFPARGAAAKFGGEFVLAPLVGEPRQRGVGDVVFQIKEA